MRFRTAILLLAIGVLIVAGRAWLTTSENRPSPAAELPRLVAQVAVPALDVNVHWEKAVANFAHGFLVVPTELRSFVLDMRTGREVAGIAQLQGDFLGAVAAAQGGEGVHALSGAGGIFALAPSQGALNKVAQLPAERGDTVTGFARARLVDLGCRDMLVVREQEAFVWNLDRQAIASADVSALGEGAAWLFGDRNRLAMVKREGPAALSIWRRAVCSLSPVKIAEAKLPAGEVVATRLFGDLLFVINDAGDLFVRAAGQAGPLRRIAHDAPLPAPADWWFDSATTQLWLLTSDGELQGFKVDPGLDEVMARLGRIHLFSALSPSSYWARLLKEAASKVENPQTPAEMIKDESERAFVAYWPDQRQFTVLFAGTFFALDAATLTVRAQRDMISPLGPMIEIEADGNGLLMTRAQTGRVVLHDILKRRAIDFTWPWLEYQEQSFVYNDPVALAPGMRAALLVRPDWTLAAFGLDGTKELRIVFKAPPKPQTNPVSICVADQGPRAFIADGADTLRGFDIGDVAAVESFAASIKAEGFVQKLHCDRTGEVVVAEDSLGKERVKVFRVRSGAIEPVETFDNPDRERVQLSADGNVLAIGREMYRRASAAARFEKIDTVTEYQHLALNTRTNDVAVVERNRVRVGKLEAGALRLAASTSLDLQTAEIGEVVFAAPDVLAFQRGDLQIGLVDIEGELNATLVADAGGNWGLVQLSGPTLGRFDASDLESSGWMNWVFPSDPYRPLPPEIFMRDYFEPQLVSRVVAGRWATFRPVERLAALNRIQPNVTIKAVRRGAAADIALVDVEVAGRRDPTQQNGKTETAAYDLRVFRDGQLVGQWPGVGGSKTHDGAPEKWDETAFVPGTANGGRAVHTFPIRLGRTAKGRPVALSAYAFNADRVKSETATYTGYMGPADIEERMARAFVMTVGVDRYENASLNLSFAVNDARALQDALRGMRGYEHVPITLESAVDASTETPANRRATKANIRAALARIANETTPDDLVIITFSGHGYTRADGRFYLVPEDSGTGTILSRLVSSDELSRWLTGIDAGQIALIIDACHSAASVEGASFKPGPLGDRGFGQLAYDKGMRVLAASQADDVALESNKLGHGLLSYALVVRALGKGNDGRREADTNRDGRVSLGEWLGAAEREVPRLYAELKSGSFRGLVREGHDNAPYGRGLRVERQGVQTPALFDFRRRHGVDPIVVD